MRVPGAKIPLPLGFIPPCLPTPAQKAPNGSAWVRWLALTARREGNRVWLYIRRGYDWSGKYPWIVDSLLSLRVRFIIVDGEAVWAAKDGKPYFEPLALRSRGRIFAICVPLARTNREDYCHESLDLQCE